MLATSCLPRFLYPSGILNFRATNGGRYRIAYSLHQGDIHPGGLLLALEGRRRQPQCVGVVEAIQRLLRCLPGVSAAGKAGFWPTAWRHYLGSFLVCRSRHRRAGENQRWSCDCVNFSLRDLVHFLQFTDLSRKVRRVGRARGWFFGRLDIIWVAVTPSNTCHRRVITF